MADLNGEAAPKNSLSQEQKIGFVLLLLFAIFAVALGILQIRNTMRAPFALNNAVPPNIKDEVNTADALRFRDIDRDGLNDFDELYVYTTSPYLADTDSDGIGDKDEVDRGSDPLCAMGQDCQNNPIASENYSPVSSTISAALGLEKPVEISGADLTATLTDPVQIRKLLIDAGLNPEVLKNISDGDLLALVAQTLSAAPATSSVNNISILNNLISSSTKP